MVFGRAFREESIALMKAKRCRPGGRRCCLKYRGVCVLNQEGRSSNFGRSRLQRFGVMRQPVSSSTSARICWKMVPRSGPRTGNGETVHHWKCRWLNVFSSRKSRASAGILQLKWSPFDQAISCVTVFPGYAGSSRGRVQQQPLLQEVQQRLFFISQGMLPLFNLACRPRASPARWRCRPGKPPAPPDAHSTCGKQMAYCPVPTLPV